MNAIEELKHTGFRVLYNGGPDTNPIDLSIADEDGNVAWVWGDDADDVEWECSHPAEFVEYGDKGERGECLLCGATCDWHTEKEIVDDYPDSIDEVDVCVPHDWHEADKPGGLIEELLTEMEV